MTKFSFNFGVSTYIYYKNQPKPEELHLVPILFGSTSYSCRGQILGNSKNVDQMSNEISKERKKLLRLMRVRYSRELRPWLRFVTHTRPFHTIVRQSRSTIINVIATRSGATGRKCYNENFISQGWLFWMRPVPLRRDIHTKGWVRMMMSSNSHPIGLTQFPWISWTLPSRDPYWWAGRARSVVWSRTFVRRSSLSPGHSSSCAGIAARVCHLEWFYNG